MATKKQAPLPLPALDQLPERQRDHDLLDDLIRDRLNGVPFKKIEAKYSTTTAYIKAVMHHYYYRYEET